MGNETSILKKCNVSSRARFETTEWSLFDASYDNQSFSAFTFNGDEFYNDFSKWKHVRHPYLVKFYEAGLLKNKRYILTEPVIPLRLVLDKFHRFFKLSGLYNVGDALQFLHKICQISVNNLSVDSIFISKNDPNELWKLGSLYWCSSPESEDEEFVQKLISYHTLNGTMSTLPPEDRDVKQPTLIGSQIHRRDSFAYLLLIQELFYDPENRPKLSQMLLTQPNDDDDDDDHNNRDHNFMARTLIETFNACQPNQRLNITAVLDHQLFRNCPFVQLRQFLGNFSSYDDREKYDFLKNLIENLRQFTDQSLVINIFTMIVSSRLIMSNSLIYNHVMPYFLIPSTKSTVAQTGKTGSSNCGGECDETEPNTYTLTNGETITLDPFIDSKMFSESIVPYILNLYFVHDYQIRLLLLQYLPHYGRYISSKCLKKMLLPQILLGIKDSDSELVSLTFRAVATLIDMFGVTTVLGGHNRCKYFTTGVSTNDPHHHNHNHAHGRSINHVGLCTGGSSSSSSSDHHGKSVRLISERSSPDGDEQRETSLCLQREAAKQSNEANDPEEWPDWDEQTSRNDRKTMLNPKINLAVQPPPPASGNKKMLKENFQTFDIKEIDFKEVSYSKEIDTLFMDMAPVLNFNYKKFTTMDDSIDVAKTANNDDANNHLMSRKADRVDGPDFRPIAKNIFEANHQDLDIEDIENSGWNDSLDWNDVEPNSETTTTDYLDCRTLSETDPD